MKDGACVKCGKTGHIGKDCTTGWTKDKATPAAKKDKPKSEEKKTVSVVGAPPVTPEEPVSYGRIMSEDELDYEWE